MDMQTAWMGLKLKNPLVVAACPLSYKLENIRQMEDAGASAVVMYSLFEEQISHEAQELHYYTVQGTDSFAESLSYFPEEDNYNLGPEEYLEHIREAKAATDIPIIASLNGVTRGGWIDYARRMEEAGADAIELNIYLVPTNPDVTGAEIESVYMNILAAVKACVRIPVAMKLSPFFSSIPNMARKLEQMDVDGLTLFNRFYQPELNLETLEIEPMIRLSSPGSMTLSLRWIAILYDRVGVSLCANQGIHSGEDVVKSIMAGADCVQICAVLLKNGIDAMKGILTSMDAWAEEKEYESIEQIKGSMSQKSVAEPTKFERANYMKALSSYM